MRLKRRIAGLRRLTLRQEGPDQVWVARTFSLRRRRYRLDDPGARLVATGSLRLVSPDPTALVRLVTSGLLTGELRRVELWLGAAPDWLLAGVRPPRLARTCQRFTWRRRGRGLAVDLRWSTPYDLGRGLADLLAAVVRVRPWEQASGPVYALDRTAWLTGGPPWPQGRLAGAPPAVDLDAAGRPLGPYHAVPGSVHPLPPPVLTAVANPHGRRLVGAATPYRLVGGGDRLALRDGAGRTVLCLDPAAGSEAAVLGGHLSKYAVVDVDPSSGDPTRMGTTLRGLAACGTVFAAGDPSVRAALVRLGLVAVAEPGLVDDLPGYALSVQAARRATINCDAALRRTALAGDGTVPLPTVSAIVASMREQHIEACLGQLARQTYPALEVVVALHGYDVSGQTRERWQEAMPFPLRVRSLPAGMSLGAVLGQLTRVTDGELVTKADDDDHYGPNHVTDLVLARHTSGADLVAKGARFVHLPERDETIDRTWAAPEAFDVTPAGGTMLLSRAGLAEVGGWSHSSRHVDADLLERVWAGGGLVYRTHSLEYVYVRRSSGHTFATPTSRLLSHAGRTYPGLPDAIVRPGQAAVTG